MRNGGDLFPTLHVTVPAAAWARPDVTRNGKAPLTCPASASAPPWKAAPRRESHRWEGGYAEIEKMRGGHPANLL
jgi:hypothetical protein